MEQDFTLHIIQQQLRWFVFVACFFLSTDENIDILLKLSVLQGKTVKHVR